MTLLIIIFTIAFIQIWDKDIPVHKDGWFARFIAKLAAHKNRFVQRHASVLAIVIILLLAHILVSVLSDISSWLLLPFGTLILLYSIGRGEYLSILDTFTQTCGSQDWQASTQQALALDVKLDGIEANDWTELYNRVLEAASYRGFERTFAVLFWFFILGPVGALLYRLLFLVNVRQWHSNVLTAKLLWVVEWPAVRVLGLSFAVTGNFMGCLSRWQQRFLCPSSRTEFILVEAVLGALSVGDEVQASCDVTRTELRLLRGLYVRTLWFWLAVMSLILLFF